MQDLGVVEEEHHLLALKPSLLEHTLEVLSGQKVRLCVSVQQS
jgi:hypothetical protein